MNGRSRSERVVRGDWQTPLALADAVLTTLRRRHADRAPRARPFRAVLEPTCGEGTFLLAAANAFRAAELVGYELAPDHAKVARSRLRALRQASTVTVADFFATDWDSVIAKLPSPLLVLGNPPWVTNAGVGALEGTNLPPKSNWKRSRGLEARTGKSNFDISEWMIVRLLEAMRGRNATLAMLCKSAVARRVIELIAPRGLDVSGGALHRIDARDHFDAAVDAVLFVCETTAAQREPSAPRFAVFPSLEAEVPDATLGIEDGVLVADATRFAKTRHLRGSCEPEWRSGIKHDCARVMELEARGGVWRNGDGAVVDVEDDYVFPLLKSSDVANDRRDRTRGMIVPQRLLGEDTRALAKKAPRLFRYLARHRERLDARKSSIYRGQPPFAVFGVGPYSFAPWKVAVSGLYKAISFSLVGPERGRPVVLDDTCYFLPFEDEASARTALAALDSPLARDFFAARIFWDAKRPVSKAVLQSLDLAAVAHRSRSRRAR